MRGRLTVVVTPRAQREIDEAATWWAEQGAPTLIDDAVDAALRFIQAFPEALPLVQSRGRWTTTRRASVEPIGYNLYYRYDARTATIRVQRFRHQRRRPPRV